MSGPTTAWARVFGSPWLVVLVVVLVYGLSPARATSSDPSFVPLTAYSLVHDHNLALDEFGAKRLVGHPLVISDGSLPPGAAVSDPSRLRAAVDNPDVEVMDYFPWTTSLILVPVVVATDGLSAVAGTPTSAELIRSGGFDRIHVAAASLVVLAGVLVFRATALLVFTGSRARRRVLATSSALVLALGTGAWSTISRALWQHTPSFLALTVLLYLATSIDRSPRSEAVDPWDRRVVGLGAVAAFTVIARPTNLALGFVLVAWLAYLHRRWILAALSGAGVVVLLFVVANMVLLASPVPSYYASSRIVVGDWFAEAVAANWVSPSRGLLFASPVVLLAVPGVVVAWRDRQRRPLVVALGTSVVAVTASVSAFAHWWAGHSFGARFMSEAVPQLFLLALPAVDRIFRPDSVDASPRFRRIAASAVVVLVLMSVAFHAAGSLLVVTGCWNLYPRDIDGDPSRIWSIVDSQVAEPAHRYLDPRWREAENRVCLSPAPGS